MGDLKESFNNTLYLVLSTNLSKRHFFIATLGSNYQITIANPNSLRFSAELIITSAAAKQFFLQLTEPHNIKKLPKISTNISKSNFSPHRFRFHPFTNASQRFPSPLSMILRQITAFQ